MKSKISDVNGISSTDYMKIGYVYLLEDLERGLVKIGKTRKPKQRLSTLRTSSGVKGGREFITDRINGYGSLEKRMHMHFKDQRTQGEWFNVSFNDALDILSASVPDAISDREYEDLKAECRLLSKQNADKMFKRLHTDRPKADPLHSLRLTITHLREISRYAAINADIYGALSDRSHDFRKMAESFAAASKSCGVTTEAFNSILDEIEDAIANISEDDANFLGSVLNKMTSR